MEAYITHAPNYPVLKLEREFQEAAGKKALAQFMKSFRDNFIREQDFKNLRQLGFNCIRLPFHYRLIEKSPYKYDKEGLAYLDKAARWAKEYQIWLILDLHAAPGAQNNDWHSDSFGEANFWKNKNFLSRVYALWEFLADRYRNHEWIAGYDLLNETVLNDARPLNKFYKEVIKTVRSVDKNHILFIEGNRWAQDIECLEDFKDDNYALSVHNYAPLEYVFNFIPHLKYPLKGVSMKWGKDETRSLFKKHSAIAKQRRRPVFVGEFGVNYRGGLFGEDHWLWDSLNCFAEFGFHWAYWTYKAVKNNAHPDGIYSYYENPPWVHREGPLFGWDTYPKLWKSRHAEMIRSWHTENFRENPHVLRLLQGHAQKNYELK